MNKLIDMINISTFNLILIIVIPIIMILISIILIALKRKRNEVEILGSIRPIKETISDRERLFILKPGHSYLFKNKMEKAFEIFVDQVLGGYEGLCISREYPPKIKQQYELEKTPIIWLTEEKVEGEKTIHSLQNLSLLISNFLSSAKNGVILLDGIEYLIVNHGFNSCIQFLQLLRSRIQRYSGILIAPLLVDALDIKDLKLIEREIEPYENNALDL